MKKYLWKPLMVCVLVSALSATNSPAESPPQPLEPSIPAPVEEPKATQAAAEKAGARWLGGLKKEGLVFDETAAAPGLVGRSIAGGRNSMYILNQDAWRITLGFNGTIGPDTPLETVRKQVAYIALDRVPTPGLKVQGWDIWPRTPRSSLRKGIEILAYGGGRIKLRVKWEFYALYGRDPSIEVPADASAPKDSYFSIRKSFPLDLTLDAPLAMRKRNR